MWQGQITFETPMLFALGFLVTFLFGGLTGVLLAAPPLDFHVSDTYFVVAHFHYVLFGTIVFATYAGIYFWFPKMTGRMLDETLGKVHFWLTFIGFHTTFLVQHWLGNEGMPRRYADYLPTDGFTTLNTISTIGAFILGASTLPFLWNVFKQLPLRPGGHRGRPVGLRQLAGVGHHLPAAAAQLHRAAPDPLRAAGVRAALPASTSSGSAPRRTSAGTRHRPSSPARRRARRRSPTTTRSRADAGRITTLAGMAGTQAFGCGHHGPDHGDRAGPARRQLGALRRAHPPRGGPAGRRAGRHPRAAHARGARRHPARPGGLQEAVEQAMRAIGMQVQTSVEGGDDPAARRRSDARRRGARAADHRAGVRDGRAGAGRRRREHRLDPPRRRLPGHRAGADGLAGTGPPEDTRPAPCVRGWSRSRATAGRRHRRRAGRARPARQAAHRLRRRLHARAGRGDRDARGPGGPRGGGRGARGHRGRDARRARLRRRRCAGASRCWPGCPRRSSTTSARAWS